MRAPEIKSTDEHECDDYDDADYRTRGRFLRRRREVVETNAIGENFAFGRRHGYIIGERLKGKGFRKVDNWDRGKVVGERGNSSPLTFNL